MRVDPNYIQNLSGSLNQSSSRVQQLTTELSSGLAISQLSDNPVGASEDQFLSAQLSQLDSFTQTATTEQSRLQVADTTLGEVVTQVTSAISLATSAGNSTLSAAQLTDIGTQVAGIRDQVLSLANTSYLGQYLFGGSIGTAKPFTLNSATTPPTVTYHGDTQTETVLTPGGQTIPVSVPGSSVFTASGADVLGTLNQLIADIGAGNTEAITTDSTTLTAGLQQVSAQRSVLDGALSQLSTASTYSQSEATNLQAQQTQLVEANPAEVATSLSTAETQSQALLSVIASVGNAKNDLFSYL